MEGKYTRHQRRDEGPDLCRPGLDPLQNVRDQAVDFNATWLKHGESMLLIQRVGFIALSIISIASAVWMGSAARDSFLEGGLFFVLFYATAALFLMTFGILGLMNALRFGRPRAER